MVSKITLAISQTNNKNPPEGFVPDQDASEQEFFPFELLLQDSWPSEYSEHILELFHLQHPRISVPARPQWPTKNPEEWDMSSTRMLPQITQGAIHSLRFIQYI